MPFSEKVRMLGSVRNILFLLVVGLVGPAFSVPFTFTYSGRLLDTSTGNPITGTRLIKITFWTVQSGGSQLAANAQTGVTNDTYSVSLVSGVFSQTINLSAANFHTVFPDSTTGTWVQVQDMTAGTTYPRQQFTTVPYALKVPVDGSTITYNSSGQLQLSSIGSASLPATINATTVTASGYLGVGRTTASNALAKFEVEGNRSFFAANSEQFSVGAKFNASGGAVYFGAASASATPDAVISNAGGATLMKVTNEGSAIFGDTYSLPNTLRFLDINNLDQTSTGSGVNLRLITRNVANTANVAVDMVKYRNGAFYINNNETNSNAFTSFGVGGSERVRIDSSGNVGIGTTTPGSFGSNAKFAVSNGSSYFYVADDSYTSAMFGPRKANDGFSTVLYSWSTNNSGNYWQQDASNDYLSWKQVLSGTSSQSIFHIKSSGNVGIGTASPAAKLDVAGEVKFGNTSSTCNATKEGQQRYNSTLKQMEFCNGTAWTGYNQSGPTFSAFPSAEGSTSSPSAKTKIQFDQEEFDPESCFDTLNRHFKPTKAGYYQINLLANLRMSSAGTLTLTLHLYKNGVAHKSAQQLINYNSSFAQQLSISAVVYMNGTSDFLEGYFETNGSTAYYQAGKTLTSMSGYYIRP